MPPPDVSPSMLSESFDRAVAWIEGDGVCRLVVARRNLKQFQAAAGELPAGVSLSRRTLRGSRTTSKISHLHNAKSTGERWTDEGLETKTNPMLACVLKGRADFHLGEYMLHCEAGSFILFPAGVLTPNGDLPHFDTPATHRSCDLLWLTPTQDMMHFFICHSYGRVHSKRPGNVGFLRQEQALASFAHFAREVIERQGDFARISSALLLALFGACRREIKKGRIIRWQPVPAVDDAIYPAEMGDPIQRAQSYMRAHLGQRLTIEAIAHTVYMSRSVFAERFHEETGETVVAHLTQLRLQEAQRMLRETPLSVKAICWFIGIQPARLLQIFNRHLGMSPSAFRRQFATKTDDN